MKSTENQRELSFIFYRRTFYRVLISRQFFIKPFSSPSWTFDFQIRKIPDNQSL